jgi:hypothetical protein
MSKFLKNLSSLVSGHARRAPDRDTQSGAGGADTGPLTTPLFPLNGSDADAPGATPRPSHGPAASTDLAPAVSPGALVPLPSSAPQKAPRRSASSRALNAMVRATTQVTVSTHVEPTPAPKVTRMGQRRSTVQLTETERLRLQIMQVQLKLTGIGLYDGAIDGLMNPDLVAGVRHFQTLKGMRDSGVLTTGTLTALGVHTLD